MRTEDPDSEIRWIPCARVIGMTTGGTTEGVPLAFSDRDNLCGVIPVLVRAAVFGNTGTGSFVVPLQFVDQSSLRFGIGVDVSLGCLDAAVTGESLDVA